MKRFGIPTSSLAAAALATLPAHASLPPANAPLDLEPFNYTEPEPPTREQLILKFWQQYQAQVTNCLVPEGAQDQISLVQIPETDLDIAATCDGYLDYSSNTYEEMMATGAKIMQSTSMQCGYITLQATKNQEIEIKSMTFDGVSDCTTSLEAAFPGYSFSDYDHMDLGVDPEGFKPEMCNEDHSDEEIAERCWQLRGTLD